MKKFIIIIMLLLVAGFIAARILVPDKPAKEVMIGAVSERLLGARSQELPWPPKEGKTYPNLDLMTTSGKSYSLAKLKGQAVIILPVDMRSANSQVQAGAKVYGSLNGVGLGSAIVKSLESQIGRKAYSQTKIVHLILYNSQGKAPTAKDLILWNNHFELFSKANQIVLGARQRHIMWSKKSLTFGCQYVNADFKLQIDATRGNYTYIKKKIRPQLDRSIRDDIENKEGNLKILHL